MDFNDFGNDLEDSAELLIEKLKELHPWDEEWDLKTTLKLVPLYKEELEIIRINREIEDLELKLEDFNNLIKFSAILSKDQVKLLFMEDLTKIPLILDDKYLNEDERIDLLIESKSRLKKVDSNLYLFFNHEE